MRTVRIDSYEAAPTVVDAPVLRPGAGQVLVRVAAASLNPLDVKLQRGFMHQFFPLSFPYTLGTDLAGTVEVVGAGVTRWRGGERVVVRTDPTAGGALAERALAPADQLVELPASLSFTDAAALPTAAGTAWQALFEVAKLEKGRTILIHAGAGGVGSFAIQFARRAGARVVATASGEGVAVAERLGADVVVDYRAEDFARRVSDVDVVLDTIGGDTGARSYGVLRSGGLFVATAMPPDETLAKAHGVTATFVFHMSDAERLDRVVGEVVRGVRVLVDRVVPLDGVSDAFAHQGSGRARGKVIVSIAS